MNEPIRCRALISLVARYPSNQREMNSHCGVTETKMMAAEETRGIDTNHLPSLLRDRVQSHHIKSFPVWSFKCCMLLREWGGGRESIYDALGHTFIQIVQNSLAEARNEALVTISLSEILNIPVEKVFYPHSSWFYFERSRFLLHVFYGKNKKKNGSRVCKLRLDSPSSMMLTTTPSPVTLLHHAAITFRSSPPPLYSPCAN